MDAFIETVSQILIDWVKTAITIISAMLAARKLVIIVMKAK